MIIQCTFPVSRNSIWDCVKKIGRLPPLPGYITKRSTHVNKQGAVHQIFILYDFDKSNFPEAMKYICKQLGSLGNVSEFSISAHSYDPHPCLLKLENGGDVWHNWTIVRIMKTKRNLDFLLKLAPKEIFWSPAWKIGWTKREWTEVDCQETGPGRACI